jgi:peptidoglycan/LPS O-acetylase OafA/YrhL
MTTSVTNNNFDFLRLLFASFVIITHAYPLSGTADCDVLCQLTNNQTNLSFVGVKGFFIISGYLIFQSLQRSENLKAYYWKRCLRLYPGLFVMLVLTLLFIPFIYEGTSTLFLNKNYLTYLPNNLTLYRVQYRISGVFENNPYPKAINGSLWTIPYEFTMYAFLSLLFFVKKKKHMLTLLCVFVGLFLIGNIFFSKELSRVRITLLGNYVAELGYFFLVGSLLAALHLVTWKHKRLILVICGVLMIMSSYLEFYHLGEFFLLPITILLIGLLPIPMIKDIGKTIGDLSYGIYIYGFLIQQTLVYFFKLDHIALMFYSLIIAYIFGYLSWHFVEKKALQFKNTGFKDFFRLFRQRIFSNI